jgi:hypothetical protein
VSRNCTHNVFAAGYSVVTAYTVDVVSGVVGGVLCRGRLCCSCSVCRGVEGGWKSFFLKCFKDGIGGISIVIV